MVLVVVVVVVKVLLEEVVTFTGDTDGEQNNDPLTANGTSSSLDCDWNWFRLAGGLGIGGWGAVGDTVELDAPVPPTEELRGLPLWGWLGALGSTCLLPRGEREGPHTDRCLLLAVLPGCDPSSLA